MAVQETGFLSYGGERGGSDKFRRLNFPVPSPAWPGCGHAGSGRHIQQGVLAEIHKGRERLQLMA